jgi:hypothetical protein
MSRILQVFMYVVLLGTFLVSVSSCDKDDDLNNSSSGTIAGVVTDDNGQPVSDVTVTVSGVNEDDVSVTTGGDGKYAVENVSLKIHAVTFSKTGWLTISKSISAKDYNDDKVATADVAMVNASAKIIGTITDAKNGDAPLSGVTVSVGVAGTVTTGTDGTYAIENLVVEDYTVTFTIANYVTITKAVTEADFVDGVATIKYHDGG